MHNLLCTILVSLALGVYCGCSSGTPDTSRITEKSAEPVATRQGPSSQLPPDSRIVDLTYPFDEQTIYWPTAEGFRLERGPAGITPRGYYYAANSFTTAEHGGTHIDAPIHFAEKGITVDQIPLERLIGEAALVDVEKKCADDRDYQIQIADLRAWEERHGTVLGGKIVLLRTGWGNFWPDREKYLGTQASGPEAVKSLHFPGLHPDAAKWLVEQRAIKAIGIDTPSIDFGQSTHFQSHVTLFKQGVPAFENVARLDQLPELGFSVIALPMKIAGGSGGPLRIVALLRE
jgi:kynurenine formamidase